MDKIPSSVRPLAALELLAHVRLGVQPGKLDTAAGGCKLLGGQIELNGSVSLEQVVEELQYLDEADCEDAMPGAIASVAKAALPRTVTALEAAFTAERTLDARLLMEALAAVVNHCEAAHLAPVAASVRSIVVQALQLIGLAKKPSDAGEDIPQEQRFRPAHCRADSSLAAAAAGIVARYCDDGTGETGSDTFLQQQKPIVQELLRVLTTASEQLNEYVDRRIGRVASPPIGRASWRTFGDDMARIAVVSDILRALFVAILPSWYPASERRRGGKRRGANAHHPMLPIDRAMTGAAALVEAGGDEELGKVHDVVMSACKVLGAPELLSDSLDMELDALRLLAAAADKDAANPAYMGGADADVADSALDKVVHLHDSAFDEYETSLSEYAVVHAAGRVVVAMAAARKMQRKPVPAALFDRVMSVGKLVFLDVTSSICSKGAGLACDGIVSRRVAFQSALAYATYAVIAVCNDRDLSAAIRVGADANMLSAIVDAFFDAAPERFLRDFRNSHLLDLLQFLLLTRCRNAGLQDSFYSDVRSLITTVEDNKRASILMQIDALQGLAVIGQSAANTLAGRESGALEKYGEIQEDALELRSLKGMCAACGETPLLGPLPVECPGCDDVFYCSVKCRAEHKAAHEPECGDDDEDEEGDEGDEDDDEDGDDDDEDADEEGDSEEDEDGDEDEEDDHDDDDDE